MAKKIARNLALLWAIHLSMNAFAETLSIDFVPGICYANYYNPFDVVVYERRGRSKKIDWRNCPAAVEKVQLGPTAWRKQCSPGPGCDSCQLHCDEGLQQFAVHGIRDPTRLPSQSIWENSPPNPNEVQTLNQLYEKYLGRLADPIGIEGWTKILRQSGKEAVIAGIQSSDEYRAKRQASHPLFANPLPSSPEPIGLIYKDPVSSATRPPPIDACLFGYRACKNVCASIGCLVMCIDLINKNLQCSNGRDGDVSHTNQTPFLE